MAVTRESLNSVLAQARQLQEFQVSLSHTTTHFLTLLNQLSQTAALLQEQAEDFEPQITSAVLPLTTVTKHKKKKKKKKKSTN
jgi:hypothetical protein